MRMRVHPIGIKILEDHQDLPEDVMIPSHDLGKRLNLCQELRERDSMTQGQNQGIEPVRKY